jgi:hypothetical protein
LNINMAEIIGFFVGKLRTQPKLRIIILIISSIVLVISIAAFVFSNYFNPIAGRFIELFSYAFIIVSLLMIGTSILSFIPVSVSKSDSFNFELENLRKQRMEIQQRLKNTSKKDVDVIDTILLSLNQLSEYYAINKNQAKNSFRFSVFAIVIGLITIVSGIWLFYLRSTPNIQLTAISAISGILIQFIGGANFFIYRKSLDQLNYFFDQLIKMQDIMLSIRLSEAFTNKTKKDQVQEKIIITLLERSYSHEPLPHSDVPIIEK